MDYRKNHKAVTVPDQKVVHRGQSFMWRSTVGWQLCAQWRDGSTSWQALKDLNDYNSVETAKYAVAQEIDHNPEFNWWVRAVLKKRLRITSLCQ